MTLQQIIDSFLQGDISQTEAENLLSKAWTAEGTAPAQMNAELTAWYDVLRTNPINKNPGANQGFVLNPRTLTTTTGPSGALSVGQQPSNVALEGQTDPLTAYLSRLGIGSKQNYNPGESYQAGLFDPFMGMYQTQQRLASPGGPLQNESKTSATFSDFLNRIGTGIRGLEQGARGQLRDIFGGTGAQKQTLGYEPGQALPGSEREAGGQLDPGSLSELQQLLKYGLRPTSGTLGARYAASRLPQAQQAYYGQKAAGQLGGGQVGAGPDNFLDWLKQNWQLQF